MDARLFQSPGVEEQWRSVVAPWLAEQAQAAWRDPRPTVVLTPSRAESFYLRGRLVGEGSSFFGIRFWTPSDARKFLSREISTEVAPATRAELRLTARACAEKLAERSDDPILASVAREPGPFLRAYDLLLGAGWSPAQFGADYGRELAREFEQTLAGRKIVTQAGFHRTLQREGEPIMANLLLVGFNATHWPLWDLLQAMARASREVTVALLAPRYFGEAVDQLWTSSWEEILGIEYEMAEEPPDEPSRPFSTLTSSYERGVAAETISGDLTFLAAADGARETDAIVLQVLDYLRRDSCTRLGIVFPEPHALALGIADRLRSLGILLDDGTGCLQPGLFERRPWQAWLKLQDEPSVELLVGWARACEAAGLNVDPEQITAREIAHVLDDVLGETLVDDLAFLALYLEEKSTWSRAHDVAGFLRCRVQLPEAGTFPDFFAATRRALQNLGWLAHVERLPEPPAWLLGSPWEISRRTFLGWLEDATDSRERLRGEGGNHFYGKVHLLIYAQMPGQTWSHLILTGLNEGRWPRLSETGAFESRHEWIDLNRRARGLNRRGTRAGKHGEGHEIVRENHGHCLLPEEKRDLALRDLCVALEATSHAVCLAATTVEDGRTLLSSDFFNHAYQAKTGRALDETAFRELAAATAAWRGKQAALLRESINAAVLSQDVAATGIAYAARRDATKPFGPYEFAFAEPPPEPIQLACKKWEDAWNHPATTWLGEVVGVEPWPDGQLAWPRAIGTWVHRWLSAALRASTGGGGGGDDFLRRLREIIDAEPDRISGAELHPWWIHVWGQGRAIALSLGEALAPQLQDRHFFSEYKLPSGLQIALPGTSQSDFVLRGKIDLLLIEDAPPAFEDDFSGCVCWVIDFKTGTSKNLNAKKIEKGVGLQAMLYALAVKAAGAGSVAVSLQTFDAPLDRQVKLDQIVAGATLFRSLDRLHREGIFGQRPTGETEYGYSPPYPLATRAVPSTVLEEKWSLVHGTSEKDEDK